MGRIIVADDDPIVGEMVTATLMAEGHGVGWLPDGRAALDVVRRRPPDLLILDCGMPVMSGIEVLRVIRQDQALHDLPVLMLTGRRSDTDESIARFEGATEYVRKPFEPALLVARVQRLLNGQRGWA